jgi:hypothetical protein
LLPDEVRVAATVSPRDQRCQSHRNEDNECKLRVPLKHGGSPLNQMPH